MIKNKSIMKVNITEIMIMIINNMDSESMFGQTEEYIGVNGSMVAFMEQAYYLIRLENNIVANIKMIKNTDMEPLNGIQVKN